MIRNYKMLELTFHADPPVDNESQIDLVALFRHNGREQKILGFYCGAGIYKVRYLPAEAGHYQWQVYGLVSQSGEFDIISDDSVHGMVRAYGGHFAYEDHQWFYPFGTTVYALAYQPAKRIDETITSIQNSPFNKIRLCVFPKNFKYVKQDPPYFPFQKRSNAEWDITRPDYAFWDVLDSIIQRFDNIGVQVDLILFHPYDKWGFSKMAMSDNLTYLDYLLRRLSAYPNIWWSLANEYDRLSSWNNADWSTVESYIAEHDPYHHLISCHNWFHYYDAMRANITHSSLQVKTVSLVAQERIRTGKPVIVDECCYEGNLPEHWGNITGQEMTARFWEAVTEGGYCTHGETILHPEDLEKDEDPILWWAKGGTLKGESPIRIAWLRKIAERLGGPIDPLFEGVERYRFYSPKQLKDNAALIPPEVQPMYTAISQMTDIEWARMDLGMHIYAGHVGDRAFIWYLAHQACCCYSISLPDEGYYRIDVIDTWNMTLETVENSARGNYTVRLPGNEYMAIIAVRS